MYIQALLKSKENVKYRGKKISNMYTVRKCCVLHSPWLLTKPTVGMYCNKHKRFAQSQYKGHAI